MATSHFRQQSKGVSIRAENLAFSYGARTVLDGASLSVDSSKRSCLVGSNGVGKPTILRILARELQPQGGQLIASIPAIQWHMCHGCRAASELSVSPCGSLHRRQRWQKLYVDRTLRLGEGAIQVEYGLEP